MIEQMAAVLRRVAHLIERGHLDAALAEVRTTALTVANLDLGASRDLSDEELIAKLSRDGTQDPERLAVVGRLLALEGDIHERRGDPRTAYYARRQALRLLIEAYLAGDEPIRKSATEAIPALLEALEPYALPVEAERRLIDYHEATGDFAKAEDVLFDLADSGDETARNVGEAFYARLRARSDEELDHGNLPRSEIEEGLAELHQRTSSSR
jgi:hypothetical protein